MRSLNRRIQQSANGYVASSRNTVAKGGVTRAAKNNFDSKDSMITKEKQLLKKMLTDDEQYRGMLLKGYLGSMKTTKNSPAKGGPMLGN